MVWELLRGAGWQCRQHTSHWQGMLAIKAHACLACEMCAACTATCVPEYLANQQVTVMYAYQHITLTALNAAS